MKTTNSFPVDGQIFDCKMLDYDGNTFEFELKYENGKAFFSRNREKWTDSDVAWGANDTIEKIARWVYDSCFFMTGISTEEYISNVDAQPQPPFHMREPIDYPELFMDFDRLVEAVEDGFVGAAYVDAERFNIVRHGETVHFQKCVGKEQDTFVSIHPVVRKNGKLRSPELSANARFANAVRNRVHKHCDRKKCGNLRVFAKNLLGAMWDEEKAVYESRFGIRHAQLDSVDTKTGEDIVVIVK